ncbi:uncharacterized protein TRAVEDRAFT_51836 [Trametes versicolor FP-101664 SS1]|uniref:uncharacterized protein n=1 Tax=Trametes versicolor (strain FP-101664) TaxID=717944 RepID=UPI000462250B|nr:uncharacterized protein TRAVEDRAFT_51836 [Trametes versicolor FP-101664 SS1]EIW54111.1 hypothetical protein TRAVEDRAFT_51836 [Trametes versicolor FP-101664 SS1]
MVDFFNVWDIVIGVLSLSAPFIVAYIYHQLPSKKTEANISDFKAQLSLLHARTIEVQLKVTSTPSCSEDIANMFKGLTRQINSVCIDVKIVSVAISTTSLDERQRLERMAENIGAETVHDCPTSEPPGRTPSCDTTAGDRPDVASDSASVAPDTPPSASSSSSAYGSEETSESPCSVSRQLYVGLQVHTGFLQPASSPSLPACATPPPTPPHRDGTQDSCSSESSTDASSILPTPRRKRSIPTHRTRAWAHFVRQPRGRRSLQSQKSDTTKLLGRSSTVELVDEPEEGGQWEDDPDHPLEVYHA